MNILQIFTRIPFNDNNNLSFEYLLAPPLNILKRFNPRMQIMRAAQKRQLHGNRQSCLVYPASLFIHRLFETIRPPPRLIKNFLGLIIAESTSSIARVSPLFAFPIVPTVCTGLEYFLPIRITRPKKKAGQSRRSRIAEIIRGNLSLGEKFIFKSADRDQV